MFASSNTSLLHANKIDILGLDALVLLNLFFLLKLFLYAILILLFIFFSKKIRFVKATPLFNIFFNLAQVLCLFFMIYSYLILLETIYIYTYKISNGNYISNTLNYIFLKKEFYIFCNYFQFDLFSLLLLFIAFTVGFLCLLVLTPRVTADNEYISIIFLSFLLIVFILCFTSNLFI